MSDVVLYEQDGGVAIITLNRPESLNAMNSEVLNTLPELGKKAAEDPSVRCVVVTGKGRAFSAGGDVKDMAGAPRPDGGAPAAGGLVSRSDALRRQEEFSRLLFEMPKPTIAAINGVVVGAGLSIALSADLRIASDQARFGTAFAKVGFSGDFGGSWQLQRLVGMAKAKELYFFADVFDVTKAQELGLVTKVVPHDSLMEETMALAHRLANGPTLAYARMKQNFAYGTTNTFGDTLTVEAENMIASSQTEDHRNAARAFVEKRQPEFHGR